MPGFQPNPETFGSDAGKQMLAASAAMDSEALEKGTPARAKAIGETDSNLVATLDDYAAISSGIGRMIASAPASRPGMRRTRGLGGDVGP
mmetsp:Transcript_6836/g.8050  ORF Transcript_6836/g.8050 Transcript_6836/m.8050 type:complete len:90 (+) Transcript_6836:41-310(+)